MQIYWCTKSLFSDIWSWETICTLFILKHSWSWRKRFRALQASSRGGVSQADLNLSHKQQDNSSQHTQDGWIQRQWRQQHESRKQHRTTQTDFLLESSAAWNNTLRWLKVSAGLQRKGEWSVAGVAHIFYVIYRKTYAHSHCKQTL